MKDGDRDAAMRLADLVAVDKNLGRLLSDARSDDYAAKMVAKLNGQEMRLGFQLERGDTRKYNALLGEFGRWHELQHRVDSGDANAGSVLAHLLLRHGDVDALRMRADGGDAHAARLLPQALAQAGLSDELRDRADSGDRHAARELAEYLVKTGDLTRLRDRADSSDRHAARELAKYLAKTGDLEELRQRAVRGDVEATEALIITLGRLGHLDELRALASRGHNRALRELIEVLPRHYDWDLLNALALSGDQYAAAAVEDWSSRPTAGLPDIARELPDIIEWVALAAGAGVVGGSATDGIKALYRKFVRRNKRTRAKVHQSVTDADAETLARAAVLTWYKSRGIVVDEVRPLTIVILDRKNGCAELTVIDSTGRRLAVLVTAEEAAPAEISVRVTEEP